MNVCMLAYAYYINDARIKSYVRTLERAEHRVDVIALRADGESVVEKGPTGTIFRIVSKYQGQSTIMYACSYLAFFLRSLLLLTRLSLKQRYALVHVHNMPNVLVFAAIVSKMFGARVMLDVHDLMPVNYMAKFKSNEESLIIKVLKTEQRISTLFANHVFCADHNQREYLVDHCNVPAAKITVLMNLPNTELFRPVTVQKNKDVFRIVYHGTVAHRLGIDLIVRAMAKVTERIPAELWIYGSGDYLPDALALTHQLGLERKVHFSHTFFPVEQIPDMVSGMDLGVIGNRRNLACDKYMLPVKLLEYVYLGIPVVAPRLAVIARYFDDTMVQFYDPEDLQQMADAIVDLYCNPQKREALARAAYRFYEEHNIKMQSDLYLALVVGSSSRWCLAATPHA